MKPASPPLSGVAIRRLQRCIDERGDLHELLRANWPDAVPVAQWNVMSTRAGVLRGLAVHLETTGTCLVIEGRAWLGLADLREASPTFGGATVLALTGDDLQACTIPPGVAHGLWFETDGIALAGLSRRFDAADKIGARWDDPALRIPWPGGTPELLEHDAAWPPATVALERVRAGTLRGPEPACPAR